MALLLDDSLRLEEISSFTLTGITLHTSLTLFSAFVSEKLFVLAELLGPVPTLVLWIGNHTAAKTQLYMETANL